MTSTTQRPKGKATNSLDDYLSDDMGGFGGIFTDDEQGTANNTAPKASATEGLGIDKEVEVTKRVREPRVKLDEFRLLSDKGIPALRKRARVLKIKGKGHEFSDTYRLLSMYQLWLDDLFPKARFADALAMVEKEGHKTSMHKMRTEWINESRPRDDVAEVDEFSQDQETAAAETTGPQQPTTDMPRPAEHESGLDLIPDDVFDGDDMDDMMAGSGPGFNSRPSAIPDEDELDEMMAMASEMHGDLPDRPPPPRAPPADEPPPDMDEMDDLDAFMEEARKAA